MSKEAMRLALEALEWCHGGEPCGTAEAITALREALAEQPAHQWQSTADKCELEKVPANGSLLPAPVAKPHEQEPVALKPCWYESKEKTMCRKCGQIHSEAISPAAQRTWVGLTDEEITDIWAGTSPYYHEDDFAKAIEAKLRERNT